MALRFYTLWNRIALAAAVLLLACGDGGEADGAVQGQGIDGRDPQGLGASGGVGGDNGTGGAGTGEGASSKGDRKSVV